MSDLDPKGVKGQTCWFDKSVPFQQRGYQAEKNKENK